MRQIYRIMSELLLPGLVCAILLALVLGMSLLPGLGEHMNLPEEAYAAYQDVKQIKIVCDREPPQIVRSGPGNVRPGEKIPLEQIFRGTDTQGNDTKVQVLEIQDGNGNTRMDCYDRVGHTLTFPAKGAYLLKLQSMDAERKTAVKRFMLLVDARQGVI